MTTKTDNIKNQDIISYKSNDGQISFGVNVFEETVWLTQKQMAELFQRDRTVITKHINNVFKEKELEEKVVCAKFAHTTTHGAIKDKTQEQSTKYYNLDVIISVGYRVKSQRGTQFRKWATNILKQYLLNGHAINEQRIRALEKKIDSLPSEIKEELLSEIEKKFDIKINEINKSLLKIANRPINITNQISLASYKLEDKVTELLDEIIKQIKNDQDLKNQLEEVKEDIKSIPKDRKTKNKIIYFFNKLGDNKSDLHKTIEGIGMSKKLITELVKLGDKLKDLFF